MTKVVKSNLAHCIDFSLDNIAMEFEYELVQMDLIAPDRYSLQCFGGFYRTCHTIYNGLSCFIGTNDVDEIMPNETNNFGLKKLALRCVS